MFHCVRTPENNTKRSIEERKYVERLVDTWRFYPQHQILFKSLQNSTQKLSLLAGIIAEIAESSKLF